MSKIKGQYYRDQQSYLIRLYCIDCSNGEMLYVGKADDKYEYECKGCNGKD